MEIVIRCSCIGEINASQPNLGKGPRAGPGFFFTIVTSEFMEGPRYYHHHCQASPGDNCKSYQIIFKWCSYQVPAVHLKCTPARSYLLPPWRIKRHFRTKLNCTKLSLSFGDTFTEASPVHIVHMGQCAHCIRAPSKRGRYWEVHPPRPSRLSGGMGNGRENLFSWPFVQFVIILLAERSFKKLDHIDCIDTAHPWLGLDGYCRAQPGGFY